eukprot:9997523-Alexandrium_andersonii.AAC.1
MKRAERRDPGGAAEPRRRVAAERPGGQGAAALGSRGASPRRTKPRGPRSPRKADPREMPSQ